MKKPSKIPGFVEADLTKVAAVWQSHNADLKTLVRVGGLDPRKDFRGGDFRGWPLSGQDVRGIDFTGSDLRDTGIENAISDESTVLTGAVLDFGASRLPPGMMRQYDLVHRIRAYNDNTDEALINRAYVFAMKSHGEQRRASGDPHFSGTLEVADILTRFHVDDATVSAALLMDVLNQTSATRAEIDEIFGKEIGSLASTLAKVRKSNFLTESDSKEQRSIFLAMIADVRVILIQVAGRLNALRGVESLHPSERQLIAREAMEIYAPLAGRMGLQEVRREFEEIAFRELHPEAYQVVKERLLAMRGRHEHLIENIEDQLSRRLHEAGVESQVISEPESPYSIWQKMQQGSVAFEQLADVCKFRVVVQSVSQCYRALGAIQSAWTSVPGLLTDHISMPRSDGYQSIEATVIAPGGHRIALLVRTQAMDDSIKHDARAALLAQLKRPDASVAKDFNGYIELRRTIEVLDSISDPAEFLGHVRLELQQKPVCCFTPKGKLISLPYDAVVVDFAYAVHTDVGDGAIACKINGTHGSLMDRLRNGDQVEIITSEGQNSPPLFWENVVKTAKARAAIQRAIGEPTLTEARRGWQEVHAILNAAGWPLQQSKLAGEQINKLLAAVGRNERSASAAARQIRDGIEP